MEHGCRNFHYRSNLAKSCKLRELTLKFHRENYERKEGGKNRISQVLKAGRRGKGKRRKRRRKKEKEKKRKEKEDRKHVVEREILRKLGTRLNRSDGGRVFLARFIDSVSAAEGADQLRTIRIAFGIYYQMVFRS